MYRHWVCPSIYRPLFILLNLCNQPISPSLAHLTGSVMSSSAFSNHELKAEAFLAKVRYSSSIWRNCSCTCNINNLLINGCSIYNNGLFDKIIKCNNNLIIVISFEEVSLLFVFKDLAYYRLSLICKSIF